MSIEFPTLAEELKRHRPSMLRSYPARCRCKQEYTDWDEHLATAWREACTIRTAVHLAALPHGSLVQVAYTSRAGWKITERWERRNEVWHCLSAPLRPPAGSDGFPSLPARLLWHPDWWVDPE